MRAVPHDAVAGANIERGPRMDRAVPGEPTRIASAVLEWQNYREAAAVSANQPGVCGEVTGGDAMARGAACELSIT